MDKQETAIKPTAGVYKTFQEAYDFFNKEFFDSKLPACLITMQRGRKSRGYFCAEQFEARVESAYSVHEIALNPMFFIKRTDEDILSTLLHEMVHLWQEEYGSPPRRNYHNREWAKKMEEIGLVPSNTGEEGGRKTGKQSMTHYINPSGNYCGKVALFLKDGKVIGYQDRPTITIKRSRSKNKVKYSCPTCGLNAWGKEEIQIICGADKAELIQV